jgi:uncharacterized protein YbbC (DUF1343 family)
MLRGLFYFTPDQPDRPGPTDRTDPADRRENNTYMKRAAFAMVCLLFLTAFAAAAQAAPFRYGIDVLDAGGAAALLGKRVGLVTNAAALSVRGEPSWRVLVRNGVDLKFLMAPEHGFSLDFEAGERVGSTALESLPVHSLYGVSKKPSPGVLKEIDVLAFDLQDAGVRCYTYISTMKLCMEACREAGIGFVVLDRPNPIAPVPSGGFVLEPAFESFVGAAELPFVHGMTVGEVAFWLQRSRFPGLNLEVVRMEGYRHAVFADGLDGFRFTPPSPNLRDFETLLLYPATVMLEATGVSEGRGSGAPFRIVGAPFVDGRELKRELDAYELPGVETTAIRFTPTTGRFAGQRCGGVRFRVADRRAFDPFMTSTALLLLLQKLYPEQLGLSRRAEFFDRLAGTARYRLMIAGQRPLWEILDAARETVRRFETASPGRFLYP